MHISLEVFIKDDSSTVVGILVAPMQLQAEDPERPALRNFITSLNHSEIISIFKDHHQYSHVEYCLLGSPPLSIYHYLYND